MSRKRRARKAASILLATTVIVTLLLGAAPINQGEAESENGLQILRERRVENSDLTPNTKIVLMNNSDVVASVWPGEGTSEDPYRIEYLLIETTGSDVAINVSNTDLHVVVQHCVLTSDSNQSSGIHLVNVTNFRIHNTTFQHSGSGITTESCEDLIIDENEFLNHTYCCVSLRRTNSSDVRSNLCMNCRDGVRVQWSTSNLIEQNECYHSAVGAPMAFADFPTGIKLSWVNSTEVRNNELHGFDHGINVLYSSGIEILQNNCSSSRRGLSASQVEDCDVIGNSFDGNHTSYEGIYLDDAVSSTISENSCTRNDMGIALNEDTNHNLISLNTCSNNTDGIFVSGHIGNSDNEFVSNTCDHNEVGITIDDTSRNLVQDNSLHHNNDTGISTWNVINTTITGNHILGGLEDTPVGIHFMGLRSNLTYNLVEICHVGLFLDEVATLCHIHMNIVRNTTYCISGLFGDDSQMTWNTFQYYDNIFFEGGYVVDYNYWSKYDGVDGNGDGFGDSPYVSSGLTDPHPLVYLPTTPTWVEEPSDTYVELGSAVNISLAIETGSLVPPKMRWNVNDTTHFQTTLQLSVVNRTALQVGTYPLEVEVENIYGFTIQAQFTVFIRDTTLPTISGVADFGFEEGTTGYRVNWTAYDLAPSAYVIRLDGATVKSGVWNSSSEVISVSCDGLEAGAHEYVLTCYDASGNIATDTVNVTVYPRRVPPSQLPLVALLVGGAGIAAIVIVIILKRKS
ncbi:hypothetical protein EU546_06415 [Candidatus Thorarchaeota archaeon]|nr:MAG: hypothetical protein EU546_06415 [Candidatus Thorarchaeota archaeon]